jgi:hypothetical protein
MRAAVKGELGNRFRPEFLNRLDEVLVFSNPNPNPKPKPNPNPNPYPDPNQVVVFSSLARAEVEQVLSPYISPISPLYLPYISPISPPYLPYISPISRALRGRAGRRAHDLTFTLTLPLTLTLTLARSPRS